MNFSKYASLFSIYHKGCLTARNKAWVVTFYNIVFVVKEVY